MSDTMITGRRDRAIQRAPVRRNGWTKARRKLFLDTLAATCNVTLAAAAAGMSPRAAYALRKRDAGFAVLWQEALALGYEALETALLEQALLGVNGGGIDALAIEPAALDAITGAPVDPAAAGFRPAELARLQFALQLLGKHRAEAKGDGRRVRGRQLATAAETDALLRQKMDRIARRLALKRAAAAAAGEGVGDGAGPGTGRA